MNSEKQKVGVNHIVYVRVSSFPSGCISLGIWPFNTFHEFPLSKGGATAQCKFRICNLFNVKKLKL